MLFDASRHERLSAEPWSEAAALEAITAIVRDTEARRSDDGTWPLHPLDADYDDGVASCLYFGGCGVIWALHYLQSVGAAGLSRDYLPDLEQIRAANRAWLGKFADHAAGSFLMGDTPFDLLAFGADPSAANADRLTSLIEGNLDHPARELMWGSPGTLLAALFLHEHTGDERWTDLFRATSDKLRSQLQWSEHYECHYWTQDLYDRQFTFIDAVHGFVATALPLIRGRKLLGDQVWAEWREIIATTVRRTARQENGFANWPAQLPTDDEAGRPLLMQYCHGAPGFLVCLGQFPGDELDDLLLAGGEATWAAGPLTKGSNLCHGTGGNGYAFLKLYERTQDRIWLDRARAFAMHGIAQTDADAGRYGQMRYSLWTGDPGFAVYLWDCVRGKSAFPTLDVFFG